MLFVILKKKVRQHKITMVQIFILSLSKCILIQITIIRNNIPLQKF